MNAKEQPSRQLRDAVLVNPLTGEERHIAWFDPPPPITITPAPSFQPPETCADCKAGVPFGPDGLHVSSQFSEPVF